MSEFAIVTGDEPVYTVDAHHKVGILVQDFKFEFFLNGKLHVIDVQHGFEWDGMSIPRIAWASVGCPFGPRHVLSGLIHDYLYTKKLLKRKQADELMDAILKSRGEGRYARFKIYRSVRLFGGFAWSKAGPKKPISRAI